MAEQREIGVWILLFSGVVHKVIGRIMTSILPWRQSPNPRIWTLPHSSIVKFQEKCPRDSQAQFWRMAAALGLGSAVTSNVVDIICSFLGRSWSVVASSGADVNDITNLADLESYDVLNYHPGYPILYLESAERDFERLPL